MQAARLSMSSDGLAHDSTQSMTVCQQQKQTVQQVLGYMHALSIDMW